MFVSNLEITDVNVRALYSTLQILDCNKEYFIVEENAYDAIGRILENNVAIYIREEVDKEIQDFLVSQFFHIFSKYYTKYENL